MEQNINKASKDLTELILGAVYYVALEVYFIISIVQQVKQFQSLKTEFNGLTDWQDKQNNYDSQRQQVFLIVVTAIFIILTLACAALMFSKKRQSGFGLCIPAFSEFFGIVDIIYYFKYYDNIKDFLLNSWVNILLVVIPLIIIILAFISYSGKSKLKIAAGVLMFLFAAILLFLLIFNLVKFQYYRDIPWYIRIFGLSFFEGFIYILSAVQIFISYANDKKADKLAVSNPYPFPSFQTPQPEQKSAEDVINELTEYKSLLDDGVITREEFDKKKNELLNGR